MVKYQKVGDIILLKHNPSIEEIEYIISKTKCKTIVKYNQIVGNYRKPHIKIIYGSKTETIHKENGCLFKIDVSKVMWSMGNINERKRISTISNPNETVIDMFAGIGYFTIPIAKYSKPKKIYSIEINPQSFIYLCENIKLNKLSNVVGILSDNRDVQLDNIADRVIMGYILKTRYFLDKCFQFLKEEGGYIHYHDTIYEKTIAPETVGIIEKYCKKYGYKLLNYSIHKIKKYSPGVWHVVVDVKIGK